MCGIAGIIGNTQVCTYENIYEMLELQKHRGPDDRGILGFRMENGESTENVVNGGKFDGILGFNRLSIRDLTQNGHQPMQNEKKTVTLAFNGEIYNADLYREILKGKGYTFRGFSDTEVLLNMYQEYGLDETLEKINGMFAFVIIDTAKMQMYIVRDRVGIKPMYCFEWQSNFLFSSELKSFLGIPEMTFSLDEESMQEYLAFRNVRGRTLAKGAWQVNPGEIIIYDLQEKKVTGKRKYYDLNRIERRCAPGNKKELREMECQFEDIIKNAVKRQLISDVTVGCQLSGGVDSSLITTYAKDFLTESELHAISVIFKEKRFSEEQYMDQVCKKLEIQAHKCEMNKEVLLEKLENAIWHMDTVISHPNAVGIMQLTKEARQHVTVLLSGEGADELLGGYSVFVNAYKLEQGLIPDVQCAGERISDPKEYLIKGQGFLGRNLCERICSGFRADELLQSRMELLDSLKGTLLDKQIKFEMMNYLPEVLVRQDKMSMSNSIENRVPMLDNEVIDFAFSLPREVLIARKQINKNTTRMEGKYILKEICARQYGDEFAYRSKCGFHIPFERYFQDKEFKQYFESTLIQRIKDRGFLDAKIVERLYRRLPILESYQAEMLWKAVNLEIWCQIFLDKKKVNG